VGDGGTNGGGGGGAGDCGGRRGTTGDDGGQDNIVRPGPSLLLVGQVQKIAGQTDYPVKNTDATKRT